MHQVARSAAKVLVYYMVTLARTRWQQHGLGVVHDTLSLLLQALGKPLWLM